MIALFDEHPLKKIACIILALIGLYATWTSVYRVDATEVAVFQSPLGTLSIEAQPGPYLRFWSSVHDYKKQDNYKFEWSGKPEEDHSILVQFNDGGKAHIGGNVQWEMPQDKAHVLAMHVLYGSQAGVDQALMRNAINRAMIFTAPLMSATESYAARRAEFLTIFADQLENGLYEMRTTEVRQADQITNEMRNIKITSIVRDAAGLPVRAEESPLKKYGITIQPPTITHIVYEAKVEEQIQTQRDNTLAIQTSQAEAKKAEQVAITAAKNGEAGAAKAKWDQEIVKATEVTKADKDAAVAKIIADRDSSVAKIAADRDKVVAETGANRDLAVQTLKAQTADQYKVEQTRIGEGDAARRQAVMAADGALTQKLDAWSNAQRVWADAFAHYGGEVVPRIVNGGGTTGSGNAAADFMSIMSMKAASDLSLDMKIAGPKR